MEVRGRIAGRLSIRASLLAATAAFALGWPAVTGASVRTSSPAPSAGSSARRAAARGGGLPAYNASAPYMGVNTWYAFHAGIDESRIVQLTDAVVSRGLKAAGYRYVWLDAGWWYGARTASGQIKLNRAQWPHGMAWLTHYIHSKGLLAGIYTDVGRAACRNGGSLGHFQQDIDTFAAWGFDAVKGDFCGAYALHLSPRTEYTAFARAIAHDRPRRRMILYVGNGDVWSKDYSFTAMDDWSWAPEIGAASWRTYTDLSAPDGITWGTLLRNIDADAAHPNAAGHGHWNDPDYLAPTYLTPSEARAQFTMWIILAAPLMVSADIQTLPQATITMLTNRQAIAISQDRLGRQGVAIARHGDVQLWLKPLADGSKALAVLNRGRSRGSISVSGPMIGLPRGELRVLHVWGHWTSRTRMIRASVAGRSALLLRVWPAGTPSRKR